MAGDGYGVAGLRYVEGDGALMDAFRIFDQEHILSSVLRRHVQDRQHGQVTVPSFIIFLQTHKNKGLIIYYHYYPPQGAHFLLGRPT